mmetsp:Transcript_35870/g.83474  ORF Transcript_35870/g.83474 Transcript_35870/m.83474 type:complete len:451 (-) Transcript_35870:180-1532(-)
MSPGPAQPLDGDMPRPVMPVGLRDSIPNALISLVVLSGCMLMVSLRPEAAILGYKPWFGIVTVRGLPAFGMVTVLMGLLADVGTGTVERVLRAGTTFGSYFDELADLAAFGIGPAAYFMRHSMDRGGSPLLVFVAGYSYMLASVFRVARELVIHRGRRPLFFMGLSTNMASCILVILVFLFDIFALTRWLPILVLPLSVMMAVPKKFYKDPTGYLISFDEQKRSMEEARRIEEEKQRKASEGSSKPVMPVGLKAQIPNMITGIVVLSGCTLMTSTSVLGYKPWVGMVVCFIGLIADICDGMTARALGVGTEFGSYFDELADLTAFGIGPAVYFMRHCIDCGASFPFTVLIGYSYMLASVYRIARELVVHRGHRPLFFVGVTTNMASCILVILVFIFDSLQISSWLPIFVIPLNVYMVLPKKFYKDPTGLFISFEEQKKSIEEANKAEKMQ